MGFGVSADLLDVLVTQIHDIVVSSAFVYIVGVTLVGLLVYQIFVMFRGSLDRLGVDRGLDTRVTSVDGSRVWGRREGVERELSSWGYQRLGKPVEREEWGLIDDAGNQFGDSVMVEFHERIKK